MTKEDRLRITPHQTMVYHIDIGCSIQLVFLGVKDGLYYFKNLDIGVTPEDVEECFIIMQL